VDASAELLSEFKAMRVQMAGVDDRMAGFQKEFASLREQPVTPSPTAYGTDILKSLEENDLKMDFEREGVSVLTEEVGRSSSNCSLYPTNMS
jgi:hypothetical protein